MKRVGYPEDSTQSAYSSQLIRIPLSAIVSFDFFFFFLSFPLYFSRGNSMRMSGVAMGICYWWGWGLGTIGFWRDVCAHTHDTLSDPRCLHQIRRRALIPLLIPTSSAQLVSFCQPPSCVAFFDGAGERDHCLAGLANQTERQRNPLPTSPFNSDGTQKRLSGKERRKFLS